MRSLLILNYVAEFFEIKNTIIAQFNNLKGVKIHI